MSTKGFQLRQSYAYLETGINDTKVIMSNPEILGNDVCEHFKNLVRPNTRAKLDNLAKTIYQTIQVLKVIYPELHRTEKAVSCTISNNPASLVNNFVNKVLNNNKKELDIPIKNGL